MAERIDQQPQQHSPTTDGEDRLLNAWLATADQTYAEMRRTHANARARRAAKAATA